MTAGVKDTNERGTRGEGRELIIFEPSVCKVKRRMLSLRL